MAAAPSLPPPPLALPLSAAAKAGEAAEVPLLVSVVGICAASCGSTSATVAAWRIAACGSRTGLAGAVDAAVVLVFVLLRVEGLDVWAARAREVGVDDAVRDFAV